MVSNNKTKGTEEPVCNLILVTAASPTPQLLGAINGYSQVVSGAVNLIGRGGAQALFAASVQNNLLGGNLVWAVFAFFAILNVGAGWSIRSQTTPREP